MSPIGGIKSFREFVAESRKGGLHVFDIDDTLFHTSAKVHVKKGYEVVASISNSEYNTHKLEPGHHYDYSEFRSSEIFNDKSKPMYNMIAKLKAIHKNVSQKANSKIIMNTARADFDDKETFLNKFRKHGINIDDIHVHRTGNDKSNDSIAEKKSKVMRQHLDTGNYRHATLYDDSKENLHHFLGLKNEYPHIQFNAYHVQHDGTIKKHK